MSEAIRKDNKMGTMPIGRLLISMSLPMMISMFIQALYNIIDSMFVAMISEDALTAVSLSFPLQNVIIAIGVGTGVGICLIPRHPKQSKLAEQPRMWAFSERLLLCFIIFGLTMSGIFAMQTDEDIINYGTTYFQSSASSSDILRPVFRKALWPPVIPLSMISQATARL